MPLYSSVVAKYPSSSSGSATYQYPPMQMAFELFPPPAMLSLPLARFPPELQEVPLYSSVDVSILSGAMSPPIQIASAELPPPAGEYLVVARSPPVDQLVPLNSSVATESSSPSYPPIAIAFPEFPPPARLSLAKDMGAAELQEVISSCPARGVSICRGGSWAEVSCVSRILPSW